MGHVRTFRAFGAVVVIALIGAGCTSKALSSIENPASANTPSSGSGSTPTTASGPATGPVGTPAVITEGGQTAATVTVTAVNVTTQPGSQYGEAPQNGYYAIVNLTAQATQSYTAGFLINPDDFYVLVNSQHYGWAQGNAFEALSTNQSEMEVTTLAAGESVSGLAPFDIPAAHGTVVYAPNVNGQPIAEWTF